MRMAKRKCKICGKRFETGTPRVTCSKECARIRMNKMKKAPKKHSAVRDMAAVAKEHGMTYGEYVGTLYMQRNKRL